MVDDHRRQKRISVGLPVRVKGLDLEGNRFDEVTKLIDVSTDGASFFLKVPIRRGSLLDLSLPLPRQMQHGAVAKAVYETMGLVLRIEGSDAPTNYKVAVRFKPVAGKQYRAES